jgi:hypothetical protein
MEANTQIGTETVKAKKRKDNKMDKIQSDKNIWKRRKWKLDQTENTETN